MTDDLFAEVNGDRVRVVRTGASVVLADLSEESYPKIGRDAAGRTRVAQMTTLGDYKILNTDKPLLIETVGTGSGSFGNNKYAMSVQSGQYLIRQSKRFHPYFSGKSQLAEFTFDGFGLQPGVTKRVGYFSSTGNYDGIWLENDGTTVYLKAARAGVETISVAMEDWSGYSDVQGYNWNNFTVILFDFLWLGGAILNFWMKLPDGFLLVHSVPYAGTAPDIFIRSPNQPVRYEIRGVSGTGSLRYICCQVATEGSIEESGANRSVDTGSTGISMALLGTTYPLKAIRKKSDHRDIAVSVDDLFVFITSLSDTVRWSLQINPTLSGALTYSDVTNSAVQEASGNGVITVTAAGTVLASGVIATGGIIPTSILKRNFLAFLGSTIGNSMDAYVLCLTPITTTIVAFGGMSFREQ